jgi:HJR/Mrr/RecB family endonuclease
VGRSARVTASTLLAVTLEGKTDDGRSVQIAAVPWFKLIDLALRNPNALHQLSWREMELFIASIYEQQGYDVVLTPPSNDGGRDVIATKEASDPFASSIR